MHHPTRRDHQGVLHAEAVAARKSISALLREWIDERLDFPENGD
jgi:hypothetical protein